MRGHRLPSTSSIHIDVGKPDLGHDLALCVQSGRQSPYIADVAVNMGGHLVQFMVERPVADGLGQGCGTIKDIALGIRVLEFLGEYAAQSRRVPLFKGIGPGALTLDEGAFIPGLPRWTRGRAGEWTENQEPQPQRVFHMHPEDASRYQLMINRRTEPGAR
jgi:hypothetical protein